jgi:hypothetical protein
MWGKNMIGKSVLMAAILVSAAGSYANAQDSSPPEAASSQAPAPPTAVAAPSAPPTPSESGPSAPVVAYVMRDVQPTLIDSKPSNAAFGVIGAVAAISAGGDIVKRNNIANPANDTAHDLAAAYAAGHGYRFTDAPLPVDKAHPAPKREDLAAFSQGARYIVDVEPPGMTLICQPLGWSSFDLMYADRVRVTDVQTGKVIENVRCFLKPQKRPGQLSHDQLLADGAAGLKLLIKAKAAECTAAMAAELKLPLPAQEASADAIPPAPPPVPR